MSEEQIAALAAELYEAREDLQWEQQNSAHVGAALDALKAAARAVIDARDGDALQLQDAITDLQEAIPCEDCICAPCRCPNL